MRAAIGTLTCAIALFCAVPQTAHAALQAPTMQSDASMNTAVLSRINSDSELKTHNLVVSVKAGVATISGTVHNEGEKTRAAELAKAAGATRVENNIVVNATGAVRGTAGKVEDKTEAAVDKTVDAAKKAGDKTEDVAEKAADKTVDAAKKAGDKTEDVAEKAWQKTKDGWEVVVDKTAAAAKTVGNEVTDACIMTAIKTDFVGEDALKNSNINVDVDRHVVTLKGTVASEAGRTRAIDIAKHTNGVNRIVDMLTIAPK
jgi:osmotically-inducible protein OsmY